MHPLCFRLGAVFRLLSCLKLPYEKRHYLSCIFGLSVFFCLLLTSFVSANDTNTTLTCFIRLNAQGNTFVVDQPIRAEIFFPESHAMPRQIVSILKDPHNRVLRQTTFPPEPAHSRYMLHEIGCLPPGYYTYSVKQEETTGPRQLAFTKLAVIRQAPELSSDHNRYGIDAFLSWRLKQAEDVRLAASLIRKAGVGWVRDRMSWAQMQPAPDRLDLKHYRAFDALQHNAGLRILQVFHDCPLWASSALTGNEESRMHSAPANTMYAYNFFKRVAREFAEVCDYWEIWNEMDVPVFFLGTADEYAAILKASYLGIKQGNPQAKVLLGSVTFGSGEITWGGKTYQDDESDRYVEKIFENGGGEYFDIYNMHHYGSVDGLLDKIRRNKRLMQRFGCYKPIWITEMGFTSTARMTADVHPSERSQAETLVKSYCLAFSEGIEKFFYFCFPSFIEHGVSFWGIFQEQNSHWEPKPAYVALASMIQTLQDSPCIGRLAAMPDRVTALVFERKESYTMVLWAEEATTQSAALHFLRPTTCNLRSLYGKDRTFASASSLEVEVSSSPIYLFGIARGSLARQNIIPIESGAPAPPVHESSTWLREVWTEVRTPSTRLLYRQDICTGTAMVYNSLSQSVRGTLSILRKGTREPVLAQSLVVPGGTRQAVPFAIPIIWDELKGLDFDLLPEIEVSAYFTDTVSEKQTLPAVRYLRCVAPVRIHKLSLLSWQPWPEKADLTIETLADIDAPGTVRILRPRDSGTTTVLQIPFRLGQQGNLQRIRFPLPPDPGKLLGAGNDVIEVLVEVEGLSVRKNLYLEFDGILKRGGPLIIDGENRDWPLTPAFHLEGRDNVVIGKEAIDRPDDVAGRACALWDEKHLYLFVEIIDESLTNPYRQTHPWTGDAVELFLDLREADSLGQPHYDNSVMQLFLVPPDDAHPEPLVKIQQPNGLEAGEIKIASRQTPNGYTIEARIPWALATSTPISSGRIIAMELTLDDLDHGDYQHRQLIWRGGADNWRNPSLFQRLTLLPSMAFREPDERLP